MRTENYVLHEIIGLAIPALTSVVWAKLRLACDVAGDSSDCLHLARRLLNRVVSISDFMLFLQRIKSMMRHDPKSLVKLIVADTCA